MKNTKKVTLIMLVTFLLISCTGCSETAWERMKNKGRELLKQGEELNQELASEAAKVNAEVLESFSVDDSVINDDQEVDDNGTTQ